MHIPITSLLMVNYCEAKHPGDIDAQDCLLRQLHTGKIVISEEEMQNFINESHTEDRQQSYVDYVTDMYCTGRW